MMVRLRYVFLSFFLSVAFFCAAQDSLLINQLLHRIVSQQAIKDINFTTGNFPSYISNTLSFKTKNKDDNIFFASLVNYTLHQQYNHLLSNNRLLIDSITQQTNNLYPHFQNKNGRLTYNFWRTDTAFVFPYTRWIHYIKKNPSLPDDMDDTVLSLMAQDADSTRAAEAHAIMQGYVNNNKKSNRIEKKYRSCKAYSVWYGKNFPPVFDVCVLSNILSFVQHYHLTWTAADSASLTVILRAIKSKDYINKPVYISPYYGSISLILYHLARLMSYQRIPQLEALQTELITTTIQRLKSTNDLLEKVILSSALTKWRYAPPALQLPAGTEAIKQIENSNLPFFTGNIPSYFPSFYRHFFTQEGWLLFYHYCPAFNDVLLLEYLVLQQRFSKHSG